MPRYHELRILLPLSLYEYSIGHIYTRYRLKHRENQRSLTDLAQCIPYAHPQSTNSPPSPAVAAALSTLPPFLQPSSATSPSLSSSSSSSSSSLNIPALYTHHVHLFGGILPQWALTMLNGSQLKVHGKSWDEFPYITSRYELPSIARANITVDFAHFDLDAGNQHNVFNLSPQQLSTRTVEFCDICYDSSIEGKDTDPKYYSYAGSATMSPRGPLLSSPPSRASSSSKHQIGQPPTWYSDRKEFMCVYVLLGAEFNLPLAMIRNHAVDLSISHFTSIVIELHRLAYVWMHEWDKYVPSLTNSSQSSPQPPPSSSSSSSSSTSPLINTAESTDNIASQQGHFSHIFALFMSDATRNPPAFTPTTITSINETHIIPLGQQPPHPERVIDKNASSQFGLHPGNPIGVPSDNKRGKRGIRGMISSKL